MRDRLDRTKARFLLTQRDNDEAGNSADVIAFLLKTGAIFPAGRTELPTDAARAEGAQFFRKEKLEIIRDCADYGI